MKQGFARPTPERAPAVRPENIVLPTPLSVPPPEGKPWWLIVVGVLVVGLLVGMVGMTVANGSRMFLGAGSIFPIFMIGGVAMMMFGGRFGGQQQMSRPKLDAMRAQFMLMLDMLRETANESADSMDANYRWFHPEPTTLAAAVGSPRMWERKPDGKDLNFGVARIGVGMTRPEVTWGEPQNMPTDIELEPVTGKALQEFGRYQSVVYNLPKMVSLLVEPWYALVGNREQTLGVMRAIILPAGVLTRARPPADDRGHFRHEQVGLGQVAAALRRPASPRRRRQCRGWSTGRCVSSPPTRPNCSLGVDLSRLGTQARRRRRRRRTT